MSPPDALALLDATFRETARLISLDGKTLWSELDSWSEGTIAGGRAYDAHIIAWQSLCHVLIATNEFLYLN